MPWFSATLRILVLEGHDLEPVEYRDTVVMIRARDFERAFRRALQLGFEQEDRYESAAGTPVEWRFKEVVTLDVVLAKKLNGAEVLSVARDLTADDLPVGDCDPAASKPAQTI